LRTRFARKLSPILVLSGLFPPVGASTSGEPIYLEANQAVYYEREERSLYTGKVVVRQGDLTIWADRLEAFTPGGELAKAVAYGKPMRFRQRSKGQEEIRGEARQAIYYPKEELVVLTGQAVVWQGSNEYRSDRIEYDMKRGIVKAGEASSDTSRVKIILKPKRSDEGRTGGDRSE